MSTLITRVSVYFAVNPGAQLSTAHMGRLFKVNPAAITKTLAYAVEKGWLTREQVKERGVKPFYLYAAGERLLRDIAQASTPLAIPVLPGGRTDVPQPRASAQQG